MKKKLLGIVFLVLISGATAVNALENSKGKYSYRNKAINYKVFSECDNIGVCSCETKFKNHQEKLIDQLNNKRDLNYFECSCGGKIIGKVNHTSKEIYKNSEECFHQKRGRDYIYKIRTIKTYECNKCEWVNEVEINEDKIRCNGV